MHMPQGILAIRSAQRQDDSVGELDFAGESGLWVYRRLLFPNPDDVRGRL